MKLGALLLTVSLACLALGGCETLSQTPGENYNRVAHSVDTTWKQIPDDVEMLLLVEKPIRLSEKPVPSH